jgi:hypothetical protein
MELESEILLETLEEEEGAQRLREKAEHAMLEKCWTAWEAGDVATIKEVRQTGQLDDSNPVPMMAHMTGEGWLGAIRCLLELVLDKEMPLAYMFKLLAEFGPYFKAERDDILE